MLCGGTPCQAFSYAGKRRSLDDYRGNLSLTFCDIADSIDEVRTICGDEPCIVFWENVPGVLSTKDNAFGCFLGQLVGADAPLSSGAKRWPCAGVVAGPKRKAAWRVLDAQHFGAPQRRRRVFVVASARERVDPAEILFERKGVRGNPAESGGEGQDAAEAVGAGAALSNTRGALSIDRAGFNQGKNAKFSFSILEDKAQTLTARGPSAVCCYDMTHACDVIRESDKVPTLQARMGTGGNQIPLVLGDKDRIYNSHLSYGVVKEETVCKTLNAQMDNQTDMPLVLSVHENQRGTITLGERMSALTAPGGKPGQGNPVVLLSENGSNRTVCVGIAPPLKTTTPCYCLAENTIGRKPQNGSDGLGVSEDLGFILNATGVHGVLAPTCVSRGGSGMGQSDSADAQLKAVFSATGRVRRLTPVECERLQGFPDNWTQIPYRGKTKENCPDAPRYKAIGNSWAVPVVRWIGNRIKENLK